MIYVSLLVVALTVVAIVKGFETRMVLFVSGLVLSVLALRPFAAFIAFFNMMTSTPLIPNIVSCMAFAEVMRYTGCDVHLIRALIQGLGKVKFILVPAATLLTFLINIPVVSPAGAAAAVGAIVIPVLMAAGVHPAAAAGAVLAGTFGHTLSPAGVHNVMIASLGKITPFEVVAVHARATITAGIVAAFVFYLTTRLRKEDKNCRANGQPVPSDAPGQPFKVNPLKALVPILPLVLVVLASPQVGIIKLGKEANTTVVTTSMIIGALACWAVSDMKAGGVSKSFFKGLGDGYGGIVGIIIAAAAFTGGMTAIGLTDALINVMKSSQSMVKLASVYGPFLIAVLSGSGDAATIAFNQAVTPSAAHFGKTIAQLGAVAQVSGALGRTMSPVAGACIATAVVANVNPFEVAKRTAPAMIVASLIILTMLA